MSRFDSRHPGAFKYVNILRNDPCVWCGSEGGSIEHITPRSKMRIVTHHEQEMGRDNWTNLASACPRCNKERGAMGMLKWILRRNSSLERTSTQGGVDVDMGSVDSSLNVYRNSDN